MADEETVPRRILIVEDESMIAMLLEDVIDEIGLAVAGPAARVVHALQLLDSGAVDGAVLDVNLAGETSYPIADALIDRGIPFVFVTGYGDSGIDPAYCAAPVVPKPFTRERLEEAFRDLRLL